MINQIRDAFAPWFNTFSDEMLLKVADNQVNLTFNKVIVPYEKITDINLEQTLVHMLFSTYSIKVNTAGSAANEIKMCCVDNGVVIQQKLKEVLKNGTGN